MITEHQEKAVDFVVDGLKTKTEIGLTGWAGTGKTYTTAEIVERLDGSVIALAPTHRACKILAQQLPGVDVQTVHSGCGLIPCDRTGKPIEVAEVKAKFADYVIIDEASMVSSHLLEKIRQLPGKKIYVGDPYQLAPVGETTTPAFVNLPCAKLTETRRYAPGSVLDELTSYLRRCIDEKKHANIAAIERAMQVVDGGVTEAARLFKQDPDNSVVVAYRNEIVSDVCKEIQGGDRYELREGEPIVMMDRWAPWDAQKNRSVVLAHNGTEGHVEHKHNDSLIRMRYAFGGSDDVPVLPPSQIKHWLDMRKKLAAMVRCSRENWRKFCLSEKSIEKYVDKSALEAMRDLSQFAIVRQTWATTAHKAQGGSYDRVIVMWDDLLRARRDAEMFARLLYVAATRVRSVDQLYFVRG